MKNLSALLIISAFLSSSALATNISGSYGLVSSVCQNTSTGVSTANEEAMKAQVEVRFDLVRSTSEVLYLVGLTANGKEIEVGTAKASSLQSNVLNMSYKTRQRAINFTLVINGGTLVVSEPVTQSAICKIGDMSVSVYSKKQ